MRVESIQYETYIIIGVLALLFFTYSIYIAHILIKKIKAMGEIKKTNNCSTTETGDMKTMYKVQEDEDLHALLFDTRNSIDRLKEEVYGSQYKVQKYIPQYSEHTEDIRDEKADIIITLQQRLQEIEHKYKRVLLLHRSITEKEQIKDRMIDEKDRSMYSLQQKLYESERRIEHMIAINEENKEKLLERKFMDIEKHIQTEKDRNQIYIILVILFVLILYIYSIS